MPLEAMRETNGCAKGFRALAMQSRRRFLTTTTTTTIALGLSPGSVFAEAANQGAGPVMSTLTDYMSAARTRALPDEVVEQAKYHLLDTIAAMISGSELPPGQAAQRYIREHSGTGPTTVVSSPLTSPPIDAALANGVLAHWDKPVDSHTKSHSHPGCSIVP